MRIIYRPPSYAAFAPRSIMYVGEVMLGDFALSWLDGCRLCTCRHPLFDLTLTIFPLECRRFQSSRTLRRSIVRAAPRPCVTSSLTHAIHIIEIMRTYRRRPCLQKGEAASAANLFLISISFFCGGVECFGVLITERLTQMSST